MKSLSTMIALIDAFHVTGNHWKICAPASSGRHIKHGFDLVSHPPTLVGTEPNPLSLILPQSMSLLAHTRHNITDTIIMTLNFLGCACFHNNFKLHLQHSSFQMANVQLWASGPSLLLKNGQHFFAQSFFLFKNGQPCFPQSSTCILGRLCYHNCFK
jgi:hypothetical protein